MPWPVAVSGRSRLVLPPALPFDPSSIAGMQLWLKSDAGAFQDDAASSPCTADGQAFKAWADQSGQGTVVNSTASATPATYKTNIINGKPALRTPVTGANMFVTTNLGAFANVPGITAFMVLQTDAKSGGGVNLMGILGNGTVRFTLSRGVTTANSDSLRTRRLDADGFDVRGASAGTVYVPGTFYYLAGVRDYANGTSALYRNGTLLDSVTGLAAGNTQNTNASGAWSTAPSAVTADVAEVIIYNSALSAANRQGIEAYLKARYAL